jgi:hypothetical protein
MAMTTKQRFLATLERRKPDRLPVITHHVMQYFLDRYLGGISSQEFFDRYGLDPITWQVLHKPAPGSGDYFDPLQGVPGFLEVRRFWSARWRTEAEDIPGQPWKTTRYRFVTPKGTLSMVTESNSSLMPRIPEPMAGGEVNLKGNLRSNTIEDLIALMYSRIQSFCLGGFMRRTG